MRRTLTEPKTALAGVMLEISFARFVASMATSSEERTLPRPFGRWELLSMNRTKAVARERCKVGVARLNANPNKDMGGPLQTELSGD